MLSRALIVETEPKLIPQAKHEAREIEQHPDTSDSRGKTLPLKSVISRCAECTWEKQIDSASGDRSSRTHVSFVIFHFFPSGVGLRRWRVADNSTTHPKGYGRDESNV